MFRGREDIEVLRFEGDVNSAVRIVQRVNATREVSSFAFRPTGNGGALEINLCHRAYHRDLLIYQNESVVVSKPAGPSAYVVMNDTELDMVFGKEAE